MNKPRSLQAKSLAANASGSVKKTPKDTTAKRAVLYLRVSTPSQVKTDYNPEGISLPGPTGGLRLEPGSSAPRSLKNMWNRAERPPISSIGRSFKKWWPGSRTRRTSTT